MTLSTRHRTRNSSPGGLGPSTLPLGQGGTPQYCLLHVDGEETFLFLSNRRDREPNPGLHVFMYKKLMKKNDSREQHLKNGCHQKNVGMDYLFAAILKMTAI